MCCIRKQPCSVLRSPCGNLASIPVALRRASSLKLYVQCCAALFPTHSYFRSCLCARSSSLWKPRTEIRSILAVRAAADLPSSLRYDMPGEVMKSGRKHNCVTLFCVMCTRLSLLYSMQYICWCSCSVISFVLLMISVMIALVVCLMLTLFLLFC